MLHIVLCPTTAKHLSIFNQQMQHTSVPCQYTTLLPASLLSCKAPPVGKLLVYRPSNFLATFSFAVHSFARKTLIMRGDTISLADFASAFAPGNIVELIQDEFVAAVDIRPELPVEEAQRENEKLCGVVYDTEALISSLETFYPEAVEGGVSSARYEPSSIEHLDSNWDYYGIHV